MNKPDPSAATPGSRCVPVGTDRAPVPVSLPEPPVHREEGPATSRSETRTVRVDGPVPCGRRLETFQWDRISAK
jgi:hypothetical protein